MYLPYLSILVNCISGRQVSASRDEGLPENQVAGTKLRAIGDISCDIDGSIEATAKVTDPSNPSFVWDPANDG